MGPFAAIPVELVRGGIALGDWKDSESIVLVGCQCVSCSVGRYIDVTDF